MKIKDLKNPKVMQAVKILLTEKLTAEELLAQFQEDGWTLENVIELSFLADDVERAIRKSKNKVIT